MPDAEVRCAQCGGVLHPDEGQIFLVCPYCGSTVYLDTSKVVFHWALTPTLDEAEARASLARWMAGNETVKNLDTKSNVTAVEFHYFPLWLLKVRDGPGERMVLTPAAATSVTAMKDLPLPAGDLVRYEPALEAESIPPTVPLEAVLGWQTQVGTQPDQIREASLVHVPLFTFKYDFLGRSYTAVVEAASGRVLANLFPAKAEAPYRMVALVTAVVFLCLATFPLAGSSFGSAAGIPLGRLACLVGGVVAAPLAFAVAAWVASQV
ncbi:MAG TPA: hypothetical protein VLD63_00715 [Anaerolineales bacterium]|nr:hypothetical protein [Anaerolineales bacterium]